MEEEKEEGEGRVALSTTVASSFRCRWIEAAVTTNFILALLPLSVVCCQEAAQWVDTILTQS